jgi:maltose phosphorylase
MDEHCRSLVVRIKKQSIALFAKIPKEWSAYSFKINFRNQVITVSVNHQETNFVDGERFRNFE